jgi:hypothetical protein
MVFLWKTGKINSIINVIIMVKVDFLLFLKNIISLKYHKRLTYEIYSLYCS